MPRAFTFTHEHLAILREVAAGTVTISEATRRIGTSEKTCRYRMLREGITLPPSNAGIALTREQREQRWAVIERMKADGHKIAAIAEAIGITEGVLRAWIQRERITLHKRDKPPTTQRRCLGVDCGVMFASEGPHNRMCVDCRPRSVSVYAPDGYGTTGRQVSAVRRGV